MEQRNRTRALLSRAMLGVSALAMRAAYYDSGPLTTVVAPKLNQDGTAENLDRPALDNALMRDDWDQVETILRGAKAIRQAGVKYLPKFEGETNERYAVRLALSKFTNIYRDVVEGLASRPFEAPVSLVETETDLAPEQIKEFVDNVDGARNNLTVFSAETFFNGINNALDWIFVDYPDVPITTAPRSVEQEREAGIRPFWTHVLAKNVLEARSSIVGGSEELVYVRILEPSATDTDVRILYRDENGARWELWRLDKERSTPGVNGGSTVFRKISEGVFSIGVIPLVPFITGRRAGRRFFVHPPMRDASDLQIELYWQESGLKHIKALAAFPMLAGNGVTPAKAPDGTITPLIAGPMAALYAPPDGAGHSGSWQLLEPASTSMKFLADDVKETIANLRELGRNPLTAQSGASLTVITTAVAAKKGNSAVQMWAYALEDALNNALYLTARWFGIDEATARKITVKVFTDFDVDANGGEELSTLSTMRTSGNLSQRSYWKELVRRNVLSPDFDADDEEKAILDEGPPDDGTGNDDIDPITGRSKVVPIKPPVKKDAG